MKQLLKDRLFLCAHGWVGEMTHHVSVLNHTEWWNKKNKLLTKPAAYKTKMPRPVPGMMQVRVARRGERKQNRGKYYPPLRSLCRWTRQQRI